MTTTLALAGMRLIDGRGGDPIEEAVIVVEGDRLAAVGPAAKTRIPRGAPRVDLSGLTVLPGLIDCHVHLLAHIRPVQEEHSERLSHRAYRGIPWARKTLEAGVTTAPD